MLACLASFGAPAAPPPNVATSKQIQAAYLFKFTQFVEWPARAFTATNAPLVIGIIGDDPFGGDLDETVRGEFVNGHPLLVRRFSRGVKPAGCHLVFISASEQSRMPRLLARFKNAPVLTVSALEGFCQQGGMINFYLQDNKVRFEANPPAAARCGLKVSSRLLALARVVTSGPTQEKP